MAEGVRETRGQQLGHFLPLLVGKTRIASVALGIFQVDLRMRHIQITSVHHRFGLVQFLQIGLQRIFPGHPVVNPLQLALRIRGVTADEIEFLKFQRDQPALRVELGNPQTIPYRQRLLLGEYGSTGIALLFCIIPILMIARKIQCNLIRLQFGLL